MVGRKPLVEPSEVVAAVLHFKDRVLTKDKNENRNMSCYLNGRMNSAALHTFVYQGANGVKDKFGLVSGRNDPQHSLMTEENKEIRYKSNDKKRSVQNSKMYHVLLKNTWTSLLAEHFWEHTLLPCCLSFRRAKVHPYGNFYIKIVGKCTICDSYFKGIVYEKPSAILMECCTYTGNFNEVHKAKKCRMIGPAQSKAITSMITDGRSSEEISNNPSIIPTGNVIRLLKSRKIAFEKRNNDPLTAIALMKQENENKEQINMYRQYCRSVTHLQIIIDATGLVFKNFMKFGLEKTRTLFLYEDIVNNKEKQHSFTVSNMVSESHNTITISNWLANWMTSNVPQPKQTVYDQNSHWLPQCFVRLDIAHFMKLASQWPSLKLLHRKVREIILRIIGCFANTEVETSCERHNRRLMNIVSTGNIELDEQLDAIIDDAGNGSDSYEDQFCDNIYEGLEGHNDFQKWAEKVYDESEKHIQEGTGINPLYAPLIVPHIIKIMKLLPLWSGIMIPIFGFGDVIASSTAVESSFNKLKNITFKHTSLPTDIENFLDTHLLSLRGSSLLKSTEVLKTDIRNEAETKSHAMQNKINNLNMTKCSLCNSGSVPSENGAHKCLICKIPVHALSDCFVTNENPKESNAVDEWRRRSKKQLKSTSYILPNPHLSHVKLDNSRNSRLLPLLKNGSRANELKSCAFKSQNASVILSNTCAFDSIASMIMISFCDSQNYSRGLLINKTKFIDFISNLVKNGITSHTYSERAELIITSLNPNREIMEYNTSLIICDTTPKSKQANEKCEKYQEKIKDYYFVTFTTTSGTFDNLREFLSDRMNPEEKTSYEVSPFHVLVEILYWKGENIQQSSEAAPHIFAKLCDIPEVITHNSTSYELREVLRYISGKVL
ncbi:hypothetical protein QTP88_004100 [Uroleucon formosanum]